MELSANIDSYPETVTTHDGYTGRIEGIYAAVTNHFTSPELGSRGR